MYKVTATHDINLKTTTLFKYLYPNLTFNFMENNISFFDWEQNLKRKSKEKSSPKINKLGIPEDEFKKFIKTWRKENLL